MSYQLKSRSDLVRLVNLDNSTTLTDAELVFSAPVALSGSFQGRPTTRNTGVTLGFTPDSQYQGTAAITFNRLDLASLANLPGWSLKSNDSPNLYALLDKLAATTGLHFTQDDLVDAEVVTNGSDRSVTLTAKPTSLGWIGSVVVPLVAEDRYLSQELTVADLLGLDYPTDSTTDTYSQIYLRGSDFTGYGATLKALPTGVITTAAETSLVAILKAVDPFSGGALWNATEGATAWSVSGLTVVRNGLNNVAEEPTNKLFKYVLVADLRSDVPKPKGRLYLHYNEPFDPTL